MNQATITALEGVPSVPLMESCSRGELSTLAHDDVTSSIVFFKIPTIPILGSTASSYSGTPRLSRDQMLE